MINKRNKRTAALVFILQLIVVAAFSQNKAQLQNFSITDINGTTYNLFEELDAGKTVVIDFFAYYCATCQAETPAIDSIWQTNGGGDSVWVWGYETSGYGPAMVLDFANTYGATFPEFSSEDSTNQSTDDPHLTIMDMFDIYGTPTYVVICPDFSYSKYTLAFVQGAIDYCMNPLDSKTNGLADKKPELSYQDGACSIKLYSANNSSAEIRIYDILGKQVMFKYLDLIDGSNTIWIDGAVYPSGLYILKVIKGKRLVSTVKLYF